MHRIWKQREKQIGIFFSNTIEKYESIKGTTAVQMELPGNYEVDDIDK